MWLAAVLAILIIIIFVSIVLIFTHNTRQNNNLQLIQGLNDSCGGKLGCISGLVCECDTCKAGINSFCNSTSDCISNSICKNNVCVDEPPGWFNDPCENNTDCADSLICYNKTCRGPIDGPCDSVSDCVPTATRCIDSSNSITGKVCKGTGIGFDKPCNPQDPNSCANGLTCDPDVNVCKYELGQDCKCNSDCVSGLACITNVCSQPMTVDQPCISDDHCANDLSCSNSLLIDKETNKVIAESIKSNIKNIVYYNNYHILLMEDGVLMVKIRNNISTVIQPVIIDDIFVFNNILFSIIDGKLYYTKSDNIFNIKWYEIIDHTNIIHYSHSLDHKILWLQNVNNTGYLYQVKVLFADEKQISENGKCSLGQLDLQLISGTVINPNIRRIYGLNKLSYLEHNIKNGNVIKYPQQNKIIKVTQAHIDNKGQMHHLKKNDTHKKLLRDNSGKIYICHKRRCVTN